MHVDALGGGNRQNATRVYAVDFEEQFSYEAILVVYSHPHIDPYRLLFDHLPEKCKQGSGSPVLTCDCRPSPTKLSGRRSVGFTGYPYHHRLSEL